MLLDMCPLTYDIGEYQAVIDCFTDTMYTYYKPLVSVVKIRLFVSCNIIPALARSQSHVELTGCGKTTTVPCHPVRCNQDG